jgi:HEAT repeat protein
MSTSNFTLRTPKILLTLVALCVWTAVSPVPASTEPLQSPRLERAKDLIAEEQWERAIEQLKAAVADAKEKNKDEALFWLAHSQHQARDLAGAVETIVRLEQQHPASRWVKPARSLRIEIAQKLRRDDVLWYTAVAPLPPPTPRPPMAPAIAAPRPAGAPPTRPAAPSAAPPVRTPEAPPALPAPRVVPPRAPRVEGVPMPMPSPVWIPEGWSPDTNLRIQALGSLIQTDAVKVIPILKEIALESHDANEARRALFVLAQSGRPEAQTTVVEVAKQGSELVQIAAVRELGRFGGPQAAEALLQVYTIGNPRVKYQVVTSLGERSATTALLRIAETEKDRKLRETAIIHLGQAGAREQLERFYAGARVELKKPIIEGLFNARAEDALIRIAQQERDEAIRSEVLTRLRLLGTAKARAYLETQRQKR